jgi:hypothetical protein
MNWKRLNKKGGHCMIRIIFTIILALLICLIGLPSMFADEAGLQLDVGPPEQIQENTIISLDMLQNPVSQLSRISMIAPIGFSYAERNENDLMIIKTKPADQCLICFCLDQSPRSFPLLA